MDQKHAPQGQAEVKAATHCFYNTAMPKGPSLCQAFHPV